VPKCYDLLVLPIDVVPGKRGSLSLSESGQADKLNEVGGFFGIMPIKFL
jgi:hypothetical protein